MFAQVKRLTWKASLLATALSMLAFTIALAASGDLDTTFSGDGKVTTNVVPTSPGRNDKLAGIAIQPNGKIVAVGSSAVGHYDFALTRYNTNGSLDTTFSGDGRLITNFGDEEEAYDVAVQFDSKIIVTGYKCNSEYTICDVALARYNSNGTLDTTFSGDGKQTTDFGGAVNYSTSVAIQSDGKIVVAGFMSNGTDRDFAVYRYLSNGTLDTSFSGDGMVNFRFGAGRHDNAHDLVIQTDGKIVVAGSSGGNFAVARLNANGSLDKTFSVDGRQITDFGADDSVTSLALQPDGKIVAAGGKINVSPPPFFYFALARYNTDGTLDTTFNGTGRKVFNFNGGVFSDVLVQADGKIVGIGGSNDFVLVRLTNTGSFDTSFSGDGKITIDYFGSEDSGIALALRPSDGKYVLGGSVYNASGVQRDFGLARVLP